MLSDKELIQAVQDAAGTEYSVFGELGRDSDDRVALLALDRAANALIVLVVHATLATDGSTELSVDLRTELDAGVPDAGAFCTNCGAKLRPWARFCGRCGTDATGRGGTGDTDVAQLRGAVEAAIAAEYELLGEMHRKEGGGAVFFARNRATRKIVALRLNRVLGTGEFELDETMILKKGPNTRPAESGVSVSVTQVLRKLDSGPGAARSGGVPAVDHARPPYAPPRQAAGPAFDLEAPPPHRHSPEPWQPATRPNVQERQSAQPSPALRDFGPIVRRGTPVLVGTGVIAMLALLAWAALSL